MVKDVLGDVEEDSEDDEEDSEDSSVEVDPLSDHAPLAKMKPQLEAVSVFNSKSKFDDRLKAFLKDCCDDLLAKIAKTSAEDMSSIEDEMRKGFLYIKNFNHGFDVSRLESDMDTLFTCAAKYDQARSASHEKGEIVQRLEQELLDAKTKATEEAQQIESIKEEIAKLSKDLKSLESSHQDTQTKVKKLQEEIASPPIDGAALENLKNSKLLLESAQKALEDQNPFA